jgi:hypothetical protein
MLRTFILLNKKAACFEAAFWKLGCGGRIWTCDLQVMSLTSYRAAPPRAKVLSERPAVAAWTVVAVPRSNKKPEGRNEKATGLSEFFNIVIRSIRSVRRQSMSERASRLEGLAATYSPVP